MKVLTIILLISIIFTACKMESENLSSVNANSAGTSDNANSSANNRIFNTNYQIFKHKQYENLINPKVYSQETPEEFKKFDFQNFVFFSSQLEKNIKLKNGEYEKEIKYPDHWELYRANIRKPDFVDLTGDGKKEAVLIIVESTAAGSSYTTPKYLIYGEKNGQLKQIWSFVTGSEAHCGAVEVNYDSGKINMELMGDCILKKGEFYNTDKDAVSDVGLNYLTKVTYSWNGKEFAQEKREVIKLDKDK